MKLFFVSTKRTSWGGSEHLWSLIAKEALAEKHVVYISIHASLYGVLQIKELENSGAKIFKQNTISTHSLIGKIHFKLKKKFPLLLRSYKGIDFTDIDAICVGLTGTYDICYQDELLRRIENFNIPFYLISQYHDEHGSLERWKYEKARSIFPKAAKFYFVSHRNKQLCEILISSHLTNACVINNPFRYKNNPTLPFPNLGKGINFACVARLDASVKCQNILLKIFSNSPWEDREWHLNFYGEGKDKQYLLDLCEFLNLKNRVTFHGYVEDIEGIWKENHILLLPSSGEGIPLSLIEAFGFGRPAVVTDVGGNESLVEDGQTGFLAESFSEKSFGNALERAWLLKEHWEYLGENAFKKLIGEFDIKPQNRVLKDIIAGDHSQ